MGTEGKGNYTEEQLLTWLRELSSYVAEHDTMPWISSRERLLRKLRDMAADGYHRREYSYEHYGKLDRAIIDAFDRGLV